MLRRNRSFQLTFLFITIGHCLGTDVVELWSKRECNGGRKAWFSHGSALRDTRRRPGSYQSSIEARGVAKFGSKLSKTYSLRFSNTQRRSIYRKDAVGCGLVSRKFISSNFTILLTFWLNRRKESLRFRDNIIDTTIFNKTLPEWDFFGDLTTSENG